MFAKEVRVKTKNQIKSSEKKNVIRDIIKQFPTIEEEALKDVFKIKESEITLHKAQTHEGTDVSIYFVNNIPYVFKVDRSEQPIPTVYLLWKFPDILPKFYTHRNVLSKLVNGADLMLPGVIVHGVNEINLYTFKSIKKGELCTICLDDNKIPIAIGRTALCGEDMYMSGMRGRCVHLMHVFKDNLWALGDHNIIPPVDRLNNSKKPEPESEESDLSDEVENKNTTLSTATNEVVTESKINSDELVDTVTDKLNSLTMNDELLQTIFLSVLKFKSKEFQVPIIVSTFMKLMQSCCPSNVNFDLKQTTYKKFSNFLNEMKSFGVIEVREAQKGVLSIHNVNREHELIKNLRKPEWLTTDLAKKEEAIKESFVLDVVDMYKVTSQTENLFQRRYRKGDLVSAQDVRQYVTNHIKEANLQDKVNKRMVNLDVLLASTLKGANDQLSFEELFSRLFNQFTPMHCIVHKYPDNKEREEPVLKKGKFRPVEFKLEARGGNKKLTAIHNLDEFSIDAKELCQRIRTKIGCSTNIDAAAGASGSDAFVITVQGNQIHLLSELLKNEYGIQLKHMQGLDLAVKD